MLAALGVVIPELLDQFGIVHFVEPVWWRVGYAKLKASLSVAQKFNGIYNHSADHLEALNCLCKSSVDLLGLASDCSIFFYYYSAI